uniref:Uncharacterized protein n=1 Tax=Hypsibius dujardini TaxID=232323 RepID=A0A0U2JTH8_HYPDU|nr:hypothetical protein [Hypsibius dujardini]
MKPVSPVPNLVFQSVLVRIIGVLAELPLRVDIVTWGLTQPAQGSLAILPFVGPVMESTVQRANDEYSGFLKFSLTYVVEPRLKDCLQLADNIEPLMSKWYYNSSQEADVSVFIGSVPREFPQVTIKTLHRHGLRPHPTQKEALFIS